MMSTQKSIGSSLPITSETLARLRDSKQRCFESAEQKGWEIGNYFAHELAEYNDLCELEDLIAALGRSDQTLQGWLEEDCHATAAERTYFVMRPHDNEEWQAAEEFWSDVTDGHSYLAKRTGFLKGFVESVVQYWQEAKTTRD